MPGHHYGSGHLGWVPDFRVADFDCTNTYVEFTSLRCQSWNLTNPEECLLGADLLWQYEAVLDGTSRPQAGSPPVQIGATRNRSETEGGRSIRPAYHGVPAKLPHFHLDTAPAPGNGRFRRGVEAADSDAGVTDAGATSVDNRSNLVAASNADN
jgi:hypothetical protein